MGPGQELEAGLALRVGAPDEGNETAWMERVAVAVEGAVGAADDVHTVHVANAKAAEYGLGKMAAGAEGEVPVAGLGASVDHKVTTEACATHLRRLGCLVCETVVLRKDVEHDPAQRATSSSSCSVDYRLDDAKAAVAALDKT